MAVSMRRYCVICRRTLSDNELEDGLVVQAEEGLVCADCVPRIERRLRSAAPVPADIEPEPSPQEAPAPAHVAPASWRGRHPPGVVAEERRTAPREAQVDPDRAGHHVELLEDILRETRTIGRSLLYEKASLWNVIGGVTQVFTLALAVLAAARWGVDGRDILIAAILAQVMALTFFVKAR